jgi:hypothetical protein
VNKVVVFLSQSQLLVFFSADDEVFFAFNTPELSISLITFCPTKNAKIKSKQPDSDMVPPNKLAPQFTYIGPGHTPASPQPAPKSAPPTKSFGVMPLNGSANALFSG